MIVSLKVYIAARETANDTVAEGWPDGRPFESAYQSALEAASNAAFDELRENGMTEEDARVVVMEIEPELREVAREAAEVALEA